MQIRKFGKTREVIPVPNLVNLQNRSYDEFVDADTPPDRRDPRKGLEAIFREFFPIVSADEKVRVTYHGYSFSKPQHTLEECRDLGLTYQRGLKIRVRVTAEGLQEVLEDDIHLAYLPIRIGGGEFIINGSERTIVTQIQRSPGIDFGSETTGSGKRSFSCRIIPERGSWLQIEQSSRDTLVVKIDKSAKVYATCFLRALSPEHATTTAIIREFYRTERVALDARGAKEKAVGKFLAGDACHPDDEAEIIIPSCTLLTEGMIAKLRDLGIAEIEVISGVEVNGQIVPVKPDDVLLNTLRADESKDQLEALHRIYRRLRPGNPADDAKVREFFVDRFLTETRYNLGAVGRFRINRKLGVESESRILTVQDYVLALKYLLKLIRTNSLAGELDDIDHLGNRRVRPIADLLGDELRAAMLKLRRAVKEKLSRDQQSDDLKNQLAPRNLFNNQAIESAIQNFFQRGELSQVVDQSNLLSQLTHERRLSALGPGGLNRKRAGFEVRDVHTSHYGRICPIETPEGANIGLIVSLAIYATVNEYGFLVTPYRPVKDGVVSDEVVYLMADEEAEAKIAQATVELDERNRIKQEICQVRWQGQFTEVPREEVTHLDVSSKQMIGVSAALIPFLEHDDANRALMGANMMRQAVPLLITERARVVTGMEREIPKNSSMVVLAEEDGEVVGVDALSIEIKGAQGVRAYKLRKYHGLNERTCLNQVPIVRLGDRVKKGQVIADGGGTCQGELALGRNALVAFMPYDGYNFEDAIVINERLLAEDRFTSIHIEEFKVEIRETKLGKEEFTRDIPGRSDAVRHLDERGIVRVGTMVKPGDILVGKVTPKNKSELSPEERLLHAIFGRAGEDVRDDSLVMKPGIKGVVIAVKHFRRRTSLNEKDKREEQARLKAIEDRYNAEKAKLVREKFDRIWEVAGANVVNIETGEVVEYSREMSDEDVLRLHRELPVTALNFVGSKRRRAREIYEQYDPRIAELDEAMKKEQDNAKRGDDLPTGVLEMVKVFVARKLTLKVGDKMAGRHGNKGVISVIVPEEDMPFLADGRTIDICLNPLGVPSRMNVGQILETHLGWAAQALGIQVETPVFDGAKESDIRALLKEAGLPEDGKVQLYDGRTGEPLHQKTTVGVMYMLKLHHLVEDKLHARATGSYSLITQQPLGGKARFGGQRFGEMEVWALEAYGAAHVLQEILTVKSDDVDGRARIYESVVKGDGSLTYGTPMAFEVLMNEIRGLCLDIRLHRPGDLEATASEASLSFGATADDAVPDQVYIPEPTSPAEDDR
ncbi:MAG: DNA-directed RNA polymerase subunit beta [Planctomycetota bacterium]|nr:DNA-directed RNA polymerase subunit beta [Planctomycetota bacterium]MCX8040202.1 DNA-directed RNA polymerase subunit beta [Planctomycetota bacterium]MDW8372503.1 DNA-directed RNA polymerase subunit beta [Planctomycetota bacterium]